MVLKGLENLHEPCTISMSNHKTNMKDGSFIKWLMIYFTNTNTNPHKQLHDEYFNYSHPLIAVGSNEATIY